MSHGKDSLPPIIRLQYRSGDLIIKEGDYGISIYKILRGRVGIYSQSGDTEVKLATLGPGQVVGEMTFLGRAKERRSASARALEDVEVEVWHPERLAREYEEMPPILKYIANQALKRLVRMNKLLTKLSARKEAAKREAGRGRVEPGESQRQFYRKEIDRPFEYRPLDGPSHVTLTGQVKDISLGGGGAVVSSRNTKVFPHERGEEVRLHLVLPDGKEIEGRAKIVSIRRDKTPGRVFLGLNFTDMTYESKKRLGFFLMP